MTGFPTRAPIELEERPREQQWLVDTLWGEQAVGIVGGEPKCGKSILALDLAVAVAAGVPCLRHFAPARPGPVLLFAAEDAGHLVRKGLALSCSSPQKTPATSCARAWPCPALRRRRRRPPRAQGPGPVLLFAAEDAGHLVRKGLALSCSSPQKTPATSCASDGVDAPPDGIAMCHVGSGVKAKRGKGRPWNRLA